MSRKKYLGWMLISVFIITIFLIFLPVLSTSFYHKVAPVSEDGEAQLDLSEADLIKTKIYLEGQWELFWEKLIVTDHENGVAPDLIIHVPGEWSNYQINQKKLPADGYASYRLTLQNFTCDYPVALYIPDFAGAYSIYVDGELASKSGIISKNTKDIYTVPKAELYPISISGKAEYEVIVEVATTKFSGLYMTPVLCSYDEVTAENSVRNSLRLILFGIAFFAFINLFFIYLFAVRRKLHSFWMPVMIFLVLIRTMLTTEFYSFWQTALFFDLPYEKTNTLMYFVTFALKYLLLFLVQEQCGIKFSKREKTGFFVYYASLFLAYLLIPKSIYNQYLSVTIPMLTYVLDFYLFIKVYINREKLIKFGLVIFCGAALVISGLSLDSFYINGLIHMNMSIVLLLMLVIFMVILSIVYSMRYGDLYDDFTTSASKLEMARKQINMQKEYYDKLSSQFDEIRRIKHDINHIVGTMNVLTKEGNYDRLEEFLNEYTQASMLEQLPLFCNHSVANSIIGYYYIQAKREDISFESRCILDEKLSLPDSDLCIILGNALDNAITACKHMKPAQKRFISITSRSMNRYFLIQVSNSYNGQLEMKGGRLVSTKEEGSHGYGISNIKRVAEAYGGYVKIEHDGAIFTLTAAVLNHSDS